MMIFDIKSPYIFILSKKIARNQLISGTSKNKNSSKKQLLAEPVVVLEKPGYLQYWIISVLMFLQKTGSNNLQIK